MKFEDFNILFNNLKNKIIMNLLIIIIVLVNFILSLTNKATIDRNEDIGFCGFLLLIYQ